MHDLVELLGHGHTGYAYGIAPLVRRLQVGDRGAGGAHGSTGQPVGG